MASYPIPPWLTPHTDWGALALSRSRAQAEINQHAQQLNQEAEQFQQQMEMKKVALEAETKAKADQLQMQSLLSQHRMEIESAYKQAEMGLQQQRLEQVKRGVDLSYDKAAEIDARNQKFESDLSDELKINPPEVAFKNTLYRNPVGMPAAAFSAAGKPDGQDVMPKDFTTPGGVKGVMGGGRWQITPPGAGTDISIEPFGQGYNKITAGGKSRLERAIPFKFSGEKELRAIENDLFYQKYASGDAEYPTPTIKSRVEAQKKRHAELLTELEQERRAFEGARNSERGTNSVRAVYDPAKKSYLTN